MQPTIEYFRKTRRFMANHEETGGGPAFIYLDGSVGINIMEGGPHVGQFLVIFQNVDTVCETLEEAEAELYAFCRIESMFDNRGEILGLPVETTTTEESPDRSDVEVKDDPWEPLPKDYDE